MAVKTVKSSVKVTTPSIKKKFRNFNRIEAIYELVWNGFDAGADRVDVNIYRNDLGGIIKILISDNGKGIDFDSEDCGFNKYDDSEKKNSIHTHGKDGVGRFSFHKICNDAVWYTKFNSTMYKTSINSEVLEDFDTVVLTSDIENYLLGKESGTTIELLGFNGKENLPIEEDIRRYLSIEFGWYLAIKKNTTICFNNIDITIPRAILTEHNFKVNNLVFDAQFYLWTDKPSSEKSYNYYISDSGTIKLKELSKFNQKPDFYLSTILKSELFNSQDLDLIEMSSDVVNWFEVKDEILRVQQKLYTEFLRKKANNLIKKYEEKGFFLINKGVDHSYNLWREKNIKIIIREMYVADPSLFNSIKDRPAKILIRLLDKIVVSNENDSLLDILDDILDLNDEGLNRLSKVIKDSSLENIISTVEEVTKRLSTVKMLKEVMESKYHDVLETPDLQKVIERNSWLFGDQYSLIGAEEDNFNKVARNLRDKIKDIENISIEDLEENVNIEGAKRQVDLFLASKNVSYDESNNKIYKCVIIEIKRPGISLSKKHLRQLEDYAEIISKHPSFGSSDRMRFELILIGRKISKDDTYITRALDSLKIHQENGLVSKDNRIKSYVRDWFSILDEHELSHSYLLDKLKPRLPDYTDVSSEQLIDILQNQEQLT